MPLLETECNCRASTGICGCITYGTGRLDDLGYWAVRCPHGKEVHTCMIGSEETDTELGIRDLEP